MLVSVDCLLNYKELIKKKLFDKYVYNCIIPSNLIPYVLLVVYWR